jgi:excisionase family DNA binding protein
VNELTGSSSRGRKLHQTPIIQKGAGRSDATPQNPARLALTIAEAAQGLGVSRRHFERHIIGQLRIVAVGGRRLVPVRELERFLEERAVG